jgi:hypothetical protein
MDKVLPALGMAAENGTEAIQVPDEQREAAMAAFNLRNQLKGWHWATTQRFLDLLNLCIGAEWQREAARKQVFDWQASQERVLQAIMHQH